MRASQRREREGGAGLAADSSASVPAVLAERVGAAYERESVLDDVSLALPEGELVAVVGPNGAGKSTFFKLLTGLMRPQRGRLEIFGRSVAAARRAGLIAYMPQNERLDWDFPLSVREVVLAGRLSRLRAEGGVRRWLPLRFAGAEHHAAAAQALAAVEMTHLAERPIGALSGGQRKRALLARALVQEAPLLLLDEPLAGVDAGSEQVIRRLLRGARAEGRTLLLVTHDLASTHDLADRVVLLNRSVLADGRPQEVLPEQALAQAATFGLASLTPRSARNSGGRSLEEQGARP